MIKLHNWTDIYLTGKEETFGEPFQAGRGQMVESSRAQYWAAALPNQ